ncbi:substrate-binding periplasmic protein [Kiloniella antarctica]|uniref:Substrate-binding periplasmic protein n=1 Tax=Kiloniella antarctica TaxID=1550907 RepID=A0ABW5BHM2_9PROT
MVRKRISKCTVLVLFVYFVSLCMMESIALSDDKACTSIRINGASDWYPVLMHSKDTNKHHGIAMDVAREVFRRLDVPISDEPLVPWKRMIRQLNKGELDILLGAYWTQKRSSIYGYTEPLIKDEVAVFVRKGEEFSLNKLEDLIGFVGLRPMGGSYGEEFDLFAKKSLVIHGVKEDGTLELLLSGRANYAVLGRYDGIADLREMGSLERITDLPWPVASNNVHFMMSRLSPCYYLLDDINRVIRDLHKEKFIEQLEAQYLEVN